MRPVNLNTASSTELQEVPGIGPANATKILQARKSYGAFTSVDDWQANKGIGPKNWKDGKYLPVGMPAQTQAAKSSTHAATVAQTKSPPPSKPAAKGTSAPKAARSAKSPRATASEDEGR